MTTAAAKSTSGPPKRSVLKKKASAQQAIAATQVAFDGCVATIDRAASSSVAAIASSSNAAGLLDPALIISARTTATIASSVASPEPTANRALRRASENLSGQRVRGEATAARTRLP